MGPFAGGYPFLDTDVYKVLEGLAYELARTDRPPTELAAFWEEAVSLIESAQRADGYLNSYFQSPRTGREPWSDLTWGHELYCLGHLIQAGLAADRQLGDSRLLKVAMAFADLAVNRFGPDGEQAVCGHPEVEMALVELYRHTGRADYLELAKLFIDRRGHGTLANGDMPAEYFLDAVPLRDLDSVTGHAVRMMYLAAGAADVAIETGDQDLIDSLERLWNDMVRHKIYISGGLGSRHSDEAIGDRFELPSDRSYSETCAAVATMQWAWRMFLATGAAHYLDAWEWILYNAYAVGTSADGTRFFYDNPLQRRPDHRQRSGAEAAGEELRRAWFRCPCCPPNVARWTAELQDHIAVLDGRRLVIAVLTGSQIRAGGLELDIDTEYPWRPTATIRVRRADPDAPGIRLRVPGWCEGATVAVTGREPHRDTVPGWFEVDGLVRGDSIEITLPMPVRQRAADPRVDALRSQTCFTRGPVVFCAEQIDQAPSLDEIVVGTDAGRAARVGFDRVTEDDGATATLSVPARTRTPMVTDLYPVIPRPPCPSPGEGGTTAHLIPYHQWANRGSGAMRVWLPTAPTS